MNIPRPTTIDRIHYARELATGKRVLDIGGQKMPNCEITSPFAIEYSKIQRASSDYRILDYQQKPEVNYVLDLNIPGKIDHLKEILDEFRPEVILCMEVLEHINYPCAVMDVIADYTDKHPCVTFITIPNNGNWVFNALGWNHDHSVAFFRDIAWRFVTRSGLGRHEVRMFACMQRYLWYWWIVYLLAFLQPMSWGFEVRPRQR
jgi:2-polyprenyl-3-methyl-5-hydroxy-6-metoxy-1,4-benzoquinol methylase